MSTADFVPRSVKRRRLDETRAITSTSSQPKISVNRSQNASTPVALPPPKTNSRPASSRDSKDLAALVCLALSDYSLWSDAELRLCMTPAVSEEEEMQTHDSAGYIPLVHLFKNSSVFRLASTECPTEKEIEFVKALRTHAAGTIEVRMIVPGDAVYDTKRPKSGYEVRRRDFASFASSGPLERNKNDWDALTVYVENIPKQSRTVSKIANLLGSLLPMSPLSTTPSTRVQHVSFPLHHLDQSDVIPTCKGFALITLSAKDEVDHLLEGWPWNASPLPASTSIRDSHSKDERSSEYKSAHESGLRIISRSRWDALKDEYLEYRQQLIQENIAFEDEDQKRMQEKSLTFLRKPSPAPREIPPLPGSTTRLSQAQTQGEVESVLPDITPHSKFPSGCLVFVKNIHPETNKTTLRGLFSRAWDTLPGEVDYVDFSKNMDSCFLRLRLPSHAAHLVRYFAQNATVQTSGLDDTGSPGPQLASSSSPALTIAAEVVLGQREKVYWGKVPDKIKKQAVDKALDALKAEGG